jgi:hypothetical protein
LGCGLGFDLGFTCGAVLGMLCQKRVEFG